MVGLLTRARRKRKLAAAYARSMVNARRQREVFHSVERYCMFVGHPRSGHSVVGSLLDAHPEAVVSHELDALRYFQSGFRPDQLFALILEKTAADAAAGRLQGDYQYAVPGQWQGRWSTLRVIGDKMGGRSTLRMLDDPELLTRLRQALDVPLRIVHVVRNPFDNITTIHLKDPTTTLPDVVDLYFRRCEGVVQTKRETSSEELLDLRHEDLLTDTAGFMRSLCGFLDLKAEDSYIEACAGILFDAPKQTRTKIDWPPQLIAQVEERIARYPFLEGYTFAA